MIYTQLTRSALVGMACTKSRLCRDCHTQICIRKSHTTAANLNLTFENILDDVNKQRAIARLTSVDAVRTTKEYGLKADHSYAAVLVPLCTVNKEPSLILTLRSSRLKKHRGQVSFPGGNSDKSDPDFIHTALRETQEELGMDPSFFEIWGQMNPLPGSDGRKVVYPILARTGEVNDETLNINRDEVEQAFCVSIRTLCDPRYFGVTHFREGQGYTLPVYTGAAHRIWGLTAIIVHQTLSILAPGLYAHKVKNKKYYSKAQVKSTKPQQQLTTESKS
ncbi:unnamed protein product [Lymnaea stagnalis]|uniref:Nudix hydrolase domain-containing protein n=1 Tax=Lymnaea stagnalis TaxID=6523 RepID=A0AAV2HF03_LYMST